MIYKTAEELTKEYSAMTKENLVSLLVAQDLSKIKNRQLLEIDLSCSMFPDSRKTHIHEYIHDNRFLGCYGNSLIKETIDADPSRVPIISYTNYEEAREIEEKKPCRQEKSCLGWIENYLTEEEIETIKNSIKTL